MTTTTSKVRVYQNGDGTTLAFSFGFNSFVDLKGDTELAVSIVDSAGNVKPQVEGSNYTVILSPSGGVVTFKVAPLASEHVQIVSDLDIIQEKSYATFSTINGKVFERELDEIYTILAQLDLSDSHALHTIFNPITGAYYQYDVGSLQPNEFLMLDATGKHIVSAGLSSTTITSLLNTIKATQATTNALLTSAQQTATSAAQLLQTLAPDIAVIKLDMKTFKKDIQDFNAKWPHLRDLAAQIPDPSTAPSGSALIVQSGKYATVPIPTVTSVSDGAFFKRQGTAIVDGRPIEAAGSFNIGDALVVSNVAGSEVYVTATAFPTGGGSGGGTGGGTTPGTGISFVGDPDGTGIVAQHGSVAKHPVLNVDPSHIPSGYSVHPNIVLPTNFQPGISYEVTLINDPLMKEVIFMAAKSSSHTAYAPIHDDQILVGQAGIPVPKDNPLVDFMPGNTIADGTVPVWSDSLNKFVSSTNPTVTDPRLDAFLDTPGVVLDAITLTTTGLTVTNSAFKGVTKNARGEAEVVDVPAHTYTVTPDKHHIQYLYYDGSTFGTDHVGAVHAISPGGSGAPTGGKIYIAKIATDQTGAGLLIAPDSIPGRNLADRLAYIARIQGVTPFNFQIIGKSTGVLTQNSGEAYIDFYAEDPATFPKGDITSFSVVNSSFGPITISSAGTATSLRLINKLEGTGGTFATVVDGKFLIAGLFANKTAFTILLPQTSQFATMTDAKTALVEHNYVLKIPVQLRYMYGFVGYLIYKVGAAAAVDYSSATNFAFVSDVMKVGISSTTGGATIPHPAPADNGKMLTVTAGKLGYAAAPPIIAQTASVGVGQFIKKTGANTFGGSQTPETMFGRAIFGFGVATYGFALNISVNPKTLTLVRYDGATGTTATAVYNATATPQRGVPFDVTLTITPSTTEIMPYSPVTQAHATGAAIAIISATRLGDGGFLHKTATNTLSGTIFVAPSRGEGILQVIFF